MFYGVVSGKLGGKPDFFNSSCPSYRVINSIKTVTYSMTQEV